MREQERKSASSMPRDESNGDLGKEWGEMKVQWGADINTSVSRTAREKVSKFYEKM